MKFEKNLSPRVDTDSPDDDWDRSEEDPRNCFSTNAIATVVHNYSPIDELFSFDSNSHVLSNSLGENQTPHVIQEENVEYKAFPTLLPSGKFGWHYTGKVPLSPSQFFSSRLLHVSGDFAKLPDFVFFAQNVVERNRSKNGIKTEILQSPSTEKITASRILDANVVENLARRQKCFRFTASVPGTPAYWQTFSYEVLALFSQNGVHGFGIRLLVLTLNGQICWGYRGGSNGNNIWRMRKNMNWLT